MDVVKFVPLLLKPHLIELLLLLKNSGSTSKAQNNRVGKPHTFGGDTL